MSRQNFISKNAGAIGLFCIPIVIILWFCFSHREFDPSGWRSCEGTGCGCFERQRMVKDLISNYQLVGLNYAQLVNLLGMPDDELALSQYYIIDLEHKWGDIDPTGSELLVVELTPDSTVREIKYEEY